MASDKLQKLEAKLYAAEQKLKATQNDEKYCQHQLQYLNRKKRTHRICTSAEMQEAFLSEPTLLTDDEVWIW